MECERPTIIRKTRTFSMVLIVSALLLSFISTSGGGNVSSIPEGNIINVMTDDHEVDQYETLRLELNLTKGIVKEDVVLVANLNIWVMGIPPVGQQLPYADLDEGKDISISFGENITISMNVSDQDIFFDGERMLDNVSVEFAVLSLWNGTEDLETVKFILTNVNDPPELIGSIVMNDSRVLQDERVVFRSPAAADPDMDDLVYIWNMGDGTILEGESVDHVFETPGNYEVVLEVTDGELSDRITRTVEVHPKVEPPPTNDTDDDGEPENGQQDDGTPAALLLLVPILILLIIIVVLLGMIQKLQGRKDREEPPKKVWTMSPLRGPSRYEKAVLNDKLNYIAYDNKRNLDEEQVLEEDLKRWGKDWDFDPGW